MSVIPQTSASFDLSTASSDEILLPRPSHGSRPAHVAIPVDRDVRRLVKRLQDLVGAGLGLLLLAPVMLLVAILVRLDSSGPALFMQRRMGRNGREFWFLKFRTMVTDAEVKLQELEAQNESSCQVLFKIRRDPRVTRLGRFLRRSSLDELPQLFNILFNDMSLVGPRPLQVRDSLLLAQMEPAGYATRLSVPPGLTGAWQVGGRSDLDGYGMLRLDLDYIENWSLELDLKILFRTAIVVTTGRGAC